MRCRNNIKIHKRRKEEKKKTKNKKEKNKKQKTKQENFLFSQFTSNMDGLLEPMGREAGLLESFR